MEKIKVFAFDGKDLDTTKCYLYTTKFEYNRDSKEFYTMKDDLKYAGQFISHDDDGASLAGWGGYQGVEHYATFKNGLSEDRISLVRARFVETECIKPKKRAPISSMQLKPLSRSGGKKSKRKSKRNKNRR